jgi:thioredoxin 1
MKNKLLFLVAIVTIVGLLSYRNIAVEAIDTENTIENNEISKGGIEFFTGKWAETLAKAKKENKLIFLDIYATWCGPCKKLKRNTFTNKKVGAYFNANFINVTLDGEDGEGISLANKYAITSYPTLFFINGDGKVISQAVGYLNANEIIRFGKSVVK